MYAIDTEAMLEGILRWVRLESPTHERDAVNRLVDQVEADLAAAGARVSRIEGHDGYGDMLLGEAPWGETTTPGILVLAHLDTVHPLGTLDGPLPVRREDDAVYGPGICDMKGGAYLACHLLGHLVARGEPTPLPVRVLYVGDEEVGSPVSRPVIEREAARARVVLVVEPARNGGRIVTARKGVARFDLTVRGRAAHAGAFHQDGRSAIREMAHQVLALEAMTDHGRGVTVSVGTIAGGTAVNVVPEVCRVTVDARMPDPGSAEALCAAVRGLAPRDPDTALEIGGGLNRPPYEKSEAIAGLYDHARGLAAGIGFDLVDMKTGGGSDGNFTAAMGVPTLDGLGVDGAGAHTHDEHLFLSSVEPRARLLLGLLETLDADLPGPRARG